MSSSESFKEFVLETLRELETYTFSTKKMFGEYCIYVAGKDGVAKPIFLLCDNTLYVKPHAVLQSLLASSPLCPPYPNAKPHFVLDIEPALLQEVVERIFPSLKPSKRKKAK